MATLIVNASPVTALLLSRTRFSLETYWSPNQGTRSFPELKAMQKGQTIGVEAYDQH